MNCSFFINTYRIYSRGDSYPLVKPVSFGGKPLPSVLALLFCTYVLFIQYPCSTYFLFFCVIFLASNRPQQHSDEGFARINDTKMGSLLKLWQKKFS